MNIRPPTLRQLPDGRYFTSWAGKRHYLGRGAVSAGREFASSLEHWEDWRDRRAEAREIRPQLRLRVAQLAQQFIEFKGVVGMAGHYKKHLKRFVGAFETRYIDTVRVVHLDALKADMIHEWQLMPRTVNHDLNSVRAMFAYAVDRELIRPVSLGGCKNLPLPPPPDKTLSFVAVHQLVHTAPEPLKWWLGFQWLTGCRPSETIKAAKREGSFVEPGIFQLDRGKTDTRSRSKRHLVCSDFALEWFERLEPRWTRFDSYSHAVSKVFGPNVGSHRLRHSAAAHLVRWGTAREDVEVFLGHMPSRVSLTYAPIDWQPLRASVSILTI